jgi:glycogen debranching enzyme
MPIMFDRSICWNIDETISREWLIANGLGGYAAGTAAGTLTRVQHGLLVASPRETSAPQLLMAKIDEEVVFDQRTYYLGTNEYTDGTLNPAGYVHLESFRLEEGFPVFTYHLGGIDGIVLEKRIWMPQGLDTTYIHYRVVRTTPPELAERHSLRTANRVTRFHEDAHAAQRVLSLTLLPLASYRPFDTSLQGKHDWQFQVKTQHIAPDPAQQPRQSIAGCSIRARDDARAYYIFGIGHPESQTTFLPTGVWYWRFLHREDRAAGRSATDDLYLPGVFRTRLWPGDDAEFTIVITAEDVSWQTFDTRQMKRAYTEAVEYQKSVTQEQRYFGEGGVTSHTHPVLPLPPTVEDKLSSEEFLRMLLQAGNRFLSLRALPNDEMGSHLSSFFGATRTIPVLHSSFYDMGDRTRDTLIALPGLLLGTRRYAEARRILSSLGRYVSQGMLPDRLPTMTNPVRDEDYRSVDTTLWYFYALDAYLRATHDDALLEDLYEILEDSIDWYLRGTRHGIRVGKDDGLLRASQPGKALTWMNAVVDGKGGEPLTPRSGAAVEVNALWYLALSLMREWSGHFYQQGRIRRASHHYAELCQQCKRAFNERFWNESGGYLYDVIDEPGKPDSPDASLRPNQLFALSLRYPVLDAPHWQSVLEKVTQRLLTPYGLRSLAPTSEGYQGHIRGKAGKERLRGMYNGGAWPWLLGAYIDALRAFERHQYTYEERAQTPGSARRKGLELLASFREQMTTGLLGFIGSVYEGDEPHKAYEQLACARSTGEILRIYQLLSNEHVYTLDQALTK